MSSLVFSVKPCSGPQDKGQQPTHTDQSHSRKRELEFARQSIREEGDMKRKLEICMGVPWYLGWNSVRLEKSHYCGKNQNPGATR